MEMVKSIADYRCTCKERLIFKEADVVVLKSRLIKIVGDYVEIKCKRCGAWTTVPWLLLLPVPV